MTSIPAAIWRIYGNSFKRHYIRNKRPFLDFLFYFSNVHEISSIFKKKKKKNAYPSPIISEVIDAERRGYVKVSKILPRSTIR